MSAHIRDTQPWTEAEEVILKRAFLGDVTIEELSKRHLRQKETICHKLIELFSALGDEWLLFNIKCELEKEIEKKLEEAYKSESPRKHELCAEDFKYYEEPMDDKSDEFYDEIREEIWSYADDFTRSEEDGWFYSDEY